MTKKAIQFPLKILQTGDTKSLFNTHTPQRIFEQLGPSPSLLSRSSKGDKSKKMGVASVTLFLTDGIFCPASTPACRASCLGHGYSMMHWPQATKARAQRAAYFVCDREGFMAQLKKELAAHIKRSKRLGLQPACRLNGTSDIPWELLHPELFSGFPQLRYFDYTKVFARAKKYVEGEFPKNYSLTFSVQQQTTDRAKQLLEVGGNVSAVFWPKLPATWCGAPVVDGDVSDTRFMDPARTVIGLRAKGLAQTETLGLTLRPCPTCGPDAPELRLLSQSTQLEYTVVRVHGKVKRHFRRTLHRCDTCGYELAARNMVPAPKSSDLKQAA